MAKRILIADDDPDAVAAVRVVLEANGYEVDSADSGEQALERIAVAKPDALILDVMMDTLDDGFQTCWKIKNAPETKDLPILMLTGVGQETGLEFQPNDEFLPADDYAEKPLQPDDLLARVKKLLGE